MKYKKIIASMLLLVVGFSLQAQQATTTAGGNASGSGGTVSYALGQLVYATNTSSSGNERQGVQQAYEVSAVTDFSQEAGQTVPVSVFPNPTLDKLTLELEVFDTENLFYELSDMQGKVLEQKQISSLQTQINTGSLPASTYFVKIIQENKGATTYKIIKN